ncbi:MAG: crosslink repair DNA glycosylase YcaQ family protein [Alsobacter sp.]
MQARRLALAAQGFGKARPDVPSARHVDRLTERLGLLQIDSVNVLARAHTVPLYSRLGAYDPTLLDKAAYGRRGRRLFEYWGHEASLIRLELQPALRWRMARAARGQGIYTGLARFAREHEAFVETIHRSVEAQGPCTARDLGAVEGRTGSSGGWWGWSDCKKALEFLFWAGRITTATRRGGFERVYDLPERVFGAEVVEAPTPAEDEAQRTLVMVAAQGLGIATERDLRDYFRLDPGDARSRIQELVEAGRLVPVKVKGWAALAYVTPEATRPGKIAARALVSPFDPLLWERNRTERLFGIRYRLEIYTPEHKREHGYYVLPFLLGDRIVGRVDLKAERAAGRLVVKAAHRDGQADSADATQALAAELRDVARWQGLETIAVEPKGDWSAELSGLV